MSTPKSPFKQPAVVTLAPGTYYWCSCGGSQNQPYCDGSHKGTEFRPVRIDVEQEERIALCQCKLTGDAPRCDGSHKQVE